GANLPPRVNESQFCRPYQLEKVKPEVACRDQAAFDEGKLERSALRAHIKPFDQCGEDARKQSNSKVRQQRDKITTQAYRASSPPEDDQQDCGDRRDCSFAQQTADKKSEGGKVGGPAAALIE